MDFYFSLMLAGVFATSGAYWLFLDWWQDKDPDSYDKNTWFLVVIGVGYTLLWLLLVIPLEIWFRIFMGFLSSSVLIILRSILIGIRSNIRTRDYFNRRNKADGNKT